MSLLVSEVYGPVFQGEGPNLGKRTAFLRLALCNLDCAWCDSKFTWDWDHYNREAETSRVSFDTVAARVRETGCIRLVITGGEPLVQRTALKDLMPLLRTVGGIRYIEVETNGTLDPQIELFDCIDHWNVSPKLAHARVTKPRIIPPVLRAFARHGNATFKFVAQCPEDLEEVQVIVDGIGIDGKAVWIMPEGRTAEEINLHTALLWEAVARRGWNLTTRLHILTFGAERRR